MQNSLFPNIAKANPDSIVDRHLHKTQEDAFIHRQRISILFAAVLMAGFLLYIPFLSIQWDINGIIESRLTEAGGANLFTPNHMLYRPIGYAIFSLFQAFGLTVKVAVIFQYLTAISGSLCLGFLFLAIYNITERASASLLGTGFLAISWSFWKFSTDVMYIVPAAMLVSSVLMVLLQKKQSQKSITIAGFLTGLSVLMWQANVFFIPVALLLIWRLPALSIQGRLKLIIRFVLVMGLLIGGVYILVAAIVFGYRTPAGIVSWLLSHSSDDSGRSLMWGRWGLDRLKSAGYSSVASFIPLWAGLGLRDLLAGIFRLDKLIAQLSLLALPIIGGISIIGMLGKKFRNSHQFSTAIWLLMGFLLYVPFIAWWEPYETKWFIVPNLFLSGAFALIWSSEASKKYLWMLIGCITIIGLANFSSTILPFSSQPNPWMQTANCFASHTGKEDTLIPTDWFWQDYAIYFYNYEGDILHLKKDSSFQNQNIRAIEERLNQPDGGNVFVVDLDSYPVGVIDYFVTNVGIPFQTLDYFMLIPAFTCDDLTFAKIETRIAGH